MLNFQENAAAFGAFIKEHQTRVYNVVLNLVQHEQEAEELTQDVFVDVYNKPGAFRGDSAVSTWLYRIATNKCIDHLRKKERRKWKLAGMFSRKKESESIEFNHHGVDEENKEKEDII